MPGSGRCDRSVHVRLQRVECEVIERKWLVPVAESDSEPLPKTMTCRDVELLDLGGRVRVIETGSRQCRVGTHGSEWIRRLDAVSRERPHVRQIEYGAFLGGRGVDTDLEHFHGVTTRPFPRILPREHRS